MLSLAQFHLNRLPHEGPTLTLIGCLSVVFAVWAFLFLELLRERITHSAVSSGKVKQSAVLVALIFTVVLGSVAGVNYRALATFRDSHFVALGRDVCRSWRFGSMLPDQPPAATLMGRYVGVAEYTCADASEHFIDLASGRRVQEPIGFFAPVGEAKTEQ